MLTQSPPNIPQTTLMLIFMYSWLGILPVPGDAYFKWTVKWGFILNREIFPNDRILETVQRRNWGAEKLPSQYSLNTTLLDFCICVSLFLLLTSLLRQTFIITWSASIHFSFLMASPFSLGESHLLQCGKFSAMLNSGVWPSLRKPRRPDPCSHCLYMGRKEAHNVSLVIGGLFC